MVYAANALKFCVPTCVGDDFTIYSMDADGTLHETIKVGEGVEQVVLEAAGSLADTLSALAIKATIGGPLNGTDFKHLRQLIDKGNLMAIDLSDAKIVSGGTAYYESYKTSPGTLGERAFYGCKKLVYMRLPESITRIGSNAFSNTSLAEVSIPDGVVSVGGDAFAYCKQLSVVTVGEKVRTMSQGVFYSSAVKHAYVKPLTPPSVASYLFSSHPVIHVHASSLAAYKASGWAEYGTLVGDLDDILAVPLLPTDDADAGADAPVYDLLGRKVTDLQPSTLYIQNGRKIIVK